MHSNSHLGVSLAAMIHLAAATPNLTYACDTHYPWKTQDVITKGVLAFAGGAVAVPTGPGLGVELDRDALGVLHEQYLTCGVRRREDTVYMRSIEPGFEPNTAAGEALDPQASGLRVEASPGVAQVHPHRGPGRLGVAGQDGARRCCRARAGPARRGWRRSSSTRRPSRVRGSMIIIGPRESSRST